MFSMDTVDYVLWREQLHKSGSYRASHEISDRERSLCVFYWFTYVVIFSLLLLYVSMYYKSFMCITCPKCAWCCVSCVVHVVRVDDIGLLCSIIQH